MNIIYSLLTLVEHSDEDFRSMFNRFAFLLLLTISGCVTDAQAFDEKLSSDLALEIWEKAVVAQGGREKLHSVTTVFIEQSSKVRWGWGKQNWESEMVVVLPDKWWIFDDLGGTKLGVNIDMDDFGAGKQYRANNGQKSVELKPFEPNWLRAEVDANGGVRRFPGTLFLLETRWWKPTINYASRGKLRGRKVYIVKTSVYDVNIDYYFDSKTFDLIRIVKDEIRITGPDHNSRATLDLLDLKESNGIMMPTRIKNPDESGVQHLETEFNVAVDPAIFTSSPPMPPISARGKWRKTTD